jgi:hypothetical protein
MIFSHWLATLLGGSLTIHGALAAITLNVDDESESPGSPQVLPTSCLYGLLFPLRADFPAGNAHEALF